MFPCYSWNTRSSRHTPDIYHSHHPHRPHRYPSNAIPGRGTRRTVYRSYLPRAPLSSRSTIFPPPSQSPYPQRFLSFPISLILRLRGPARNSIFRLLRRFPSRFRFHRFPRHTINTLRVSGVVAPPLRTVQNSIQSTGDIPPGPRNVRQRSP